MCQLCKTIGLNRQLRCSSGEEVPIKADLRGHARTKMRRQIEADVGGFSSMLQIRAGMKTMCNQR